MTMSMKSHEEQVTPADHRLKRIVSEVLLIDDEEYQDGYGQDDIAGWDSLAMVVLGSALEKEFGLPVPVDEMAAFRSIGDIKAFCRSHGVEV